jgi:CHAD domain-containing protein
VPTSRTGTTRARTGSRTYRGGAEIGAPRLAGLPGVHDERPEPQQLLEMERYDTADRRLTAAGIALAVCRDGAQAVWQLDLPEGDGHERLRVPVVPADAVAPPLPDELDELIRTAARDLPVHPAARVRIVRHVTRLLGARGGELGELVHDQLSLATLGTATDVTSWTEVELRTGPRAPLEEIEQRLSEAGLRPAAPAADTELARVLRPQPRPHRGGRRGSAGAALVEYLAEHADRLAAEELRVRRGEPDSVHQLRVASRRMRSALQAYRPLLDRSRIEPILADLREFGRELAPARDAEVLAERIHAGLAALQPELLLGPVQAQVNRHFARAEAEAGAAVLSALDGPRYARLRTALEEFVADPPLSPAARRRAAAELPRHVARAARRLAKAVRTATDPQQEAEARDLAVHEARKAGKRLRYATEVARPDVGKPAQQFAKALKGFQTALGEHQDTVVARAALRGLGAQAHAAGENGFSFGVLHAADAARAERIEQQLPALWAEAWTKKHRRWLR